MLRLPIIVILALVGFGPSLAADSAATQLGPTLKAVRQFTKSEGDRLWPGYGEAPFGFLLIAGDQETLLCQDAAPAGFATDGTDAATGCPRLTRPRGGLPDSLLASMPIVGAQETIVMGTPQTTGRTRPEWVRTILHEHFHQYEATFPDNMQRIIALGLRKDAQDGMWMLNYPFPYADPKAAGAYAAASNALANALAARGGPGFLSAFDRYLAARNAFEHTVSPRDWRYLEFELWKEGTARWTEIVLGERYPDPEVRSVSAALRARTLAMLRTPDLKAQGRELVYPLGAGEAMLMDACGPDWRQGFPREVAMRPLLDRVRKACRGVAG